MMIHIMGEHGSKLTNVQPGDVQPNAVDLRLGKVFKIHNNVCTLSETQKGHRGSIEIQPDENGYWNLEPGTYEVVMDGWCYACPLWSI